MEKRPLDRPNITVRHSFISDIGKIISNVDPAGNFNSWAHVVFDKSRWTELVNTLESTQADWDDSDWKDNEPEKNSNKPEENSEWNKSPPSSPPSSHYSYSDSTTPPSPLSNNDISNLFETLGIAITSWLQEVKFAYRNLIQIFHPDKCNTKKPSLKKKEVQNFNMYLMHTNP